jgi:ABC-type transport system involved in multi-copper enzyme maturation permease subunit
MNELRAMLSITFIWFLSVGLSILIMIHGWGLTPKSYWWIIGAGILGHSVLTGLMQAVVKDVK